MAPAEPQYGRATARAPRVEGEVLEPTGALDEIERLHEDGRSVDALARIRALGEPPALEGIRARVLAARILGNLAAPRIARSLAIRAHRGRRDDPEAAYYYSYALAESAGILTALSFLERFEPPADASAQSRALLLLRRAGLRAALRDFAEAEALWDRATALWEHPWSWVERSAIRAQADRWADAEEAAERALALRPGYRPAVQQLAQVLIATGRRERAEDVLDEASRRLQAPFVHLQLAQLRYDRERAAEARASLEAAVALMPWPEAETVQRVSMLAANIHYKLGDLAAAACFARMSRAPAMLRLAARLEAATPRRRVSLEVPYVRQDHKTCAPATLTALCRYHGRPADHVSIVEEICYDGTPAASERRWMEEHGFLARHFTVTWDAAVALLDRGLPFALLTVDAGSAHLQAVVGCDLQRRSFLVRDPSVPILVELEADHLLEEQRFSGPQGLVVVPLEQAARLDEVALPDADRHDRLYRMQRALLRHDRAAAATELAALEASGPDHVVTCQARRALASYDGNQAALLVAFEGLLALHRDAAAPLLGKLMCLEDLARPEQRRRALADAATAPGADPIFGRLWGAELARDARHAGMAEVWLWAATRRRPTDAAAYAAMAGLAASRGEIASACRLQRIAACLEDMNEAHAAEYFRYARAANRTEEALAWLRGRLERLGPRAAGPWETLYHALRMLDRVKEAQEVLVEARRARPDDPDLVLFAAGCALRAGERQEARALLERAGGRVKEVVWTRVAAQLDRATGARDVALARWRSVLETDPLSLEAHAAIAGLLSEASDRSAAREHLRAAAAAHPHHAGLARLLLDFTEDEGEEGLEVVRRLIALAPTDAWARRELALRLARRHRIEEALAELARATELAPEAASTHGVRGFVLTAAGRREEAQEAFREALRRSADYATAFEALVDGADDAAERLEAVRFLQGELRRQVVFGDSLPAFRFAARGVISGEEVLAFLEEGRQARPDLLGCWREVVEQLVVLDRVEEARRIALECAEHFPLVPEPLLMLAWVEERREDQDAHRRALERCLALEPGHPVATRALSEALERGGDGAAARRLLEEAVARAPLDAANHGYLAELLARSGDLEGAFGALARALALEPAYEWAWAMLERWSSEHDALDRALAVADAVARERPDAGWAHLGRARLLMSRPGRTDEALRALDEALAREPRLVLAHDQRALLLASLGRHDEALRACQHPSFGDSPPVILRGRRAWILAQQGSHDDAIREMEAVVAGCPSYAFGFNNLGEWYLQRGQPAEARRCLEQALRTNPGQETTALLLFDVCLAQGDLDGCDRALAQVRRQGEAPHLLARQVQLACARGRPDAAEQLYARLCAVPHVDGWPVLEAGKALVGRGRGRQALRILEQAIAGPAGVTELLGEIWAHLAGGIRSLVALPRLPRLLAGGRGAQAAVANFIENLASRGRVVGLLVVLLLCGRALRRAGRVWGAVGYAFVQLGSCRLAAAWLRDYRARDDVRPWMLNNLALALRVLGRADEAAAVCRHALTLAPDHSTDGHRRWVAFDLAVAGNVAEAQVELARALGPETEMPALAEAYARALVSGANLPAELPDRQDRLRALVEAAEAAHPAECATRLGRRLRGAVRRRLEELAARR